MSHAAAKVARYTDASDFKVIPIIDTDTCRDLKAKIKTQFELSESFTVFICHRTPQSSNRQLLSDRALLGPIVSAFENPAATVAFDFADFVEILVRGPTGSPSIGSLVRLSSCTMAELVQQIEAEFPILKTKQSGYQITAARTEFDPKTSVVNDDRVMEFCVQGMQFFIESTETALAPAFENPYARVASVAMEEIGRDAFLRLLGCTLAFCEPIDMESLSVFSESTMPQTIMFVEKMRSLLNVSNGTVSVLHQSVKDFFLDSELCPSDFYVGSPKALSSLSKQCIGYSIPICWRLYQPATPFNYWEEVASLARSSHLHLYKSMQPNIGVAISILGRHQRPTFLNSPKSMDPTCWLPRFCPETRASLSWLCESTQPLFKNY
ncbi:hypothetical protein BDR26DRAFT_349122 [Obelidium mucronatum]|nr:hypothetical protein BDR26DRAFT_349122 [Obelidium mucronatum]